VNESTLEPESKLPGRTTPTWEMELLVSGASVFALLQLPGWMDQAYFAVQPRLDLNWEMLGQLLFTYSKIGALILAAAFVVHLVMRGYWIALVGMDSIYPDGVIWERLRIGPVQRRFLQNSVVPIGARIESADNRASIVFALGITMAMVMAGLVLVVSLSFCLTTLLHALFGWDWLFPNGTFGLVAALGLPYALAYQIDRRWGGKVSPEGSTAKVVTRIFGFYRRLGFGRDGNPSINLLQSHIGVRKITFATTMMIVLCALFAAGQLILQKSNPRFGDYARWPLANVGVEDSLLAPHYRDQPGPGKPLLPTIDSMFPAGDYLSVIVPFDPKRHPALLARGCGAVWKTADSPARRAALLACMGRLQDLRLDMKPLPQAQLRYYTDPKTGQNSMIAIVPIRGLSAGEHVLTLLRSFRPDQSANASEPDHYRIAFWR
jgi:hypothetical protein